MLMDLQDELIPQLGIDAFKSKRFQTNSEKSKCSFSIVVQGFYSYSFNGNVMKAKIGLFENG